MRTDDDSWEITESVGATAIGVAAMRAYESRREDALFHDPYAEKLVRATGSDGWTGILDRVLAGGEQIGGMYAASGMSSTMVARTVYFDDYLTAAAAVGIRQVVILAAGLDARAYRLEWPYGTRIFELDQPQVLAFKARALAGDTPAADRREVPIDLRQDWPKALLDKGFERDRPTAWLAEGLLRYLPGSAQDQLFERVLELSAPGSRMALNMGIGTEHLDPELRAQREKMMAAAGIRLKMEELFYPWEDRTDPRDWFAMHRWLVTEGNPVDVLAARGRAVPAATGPDMTKHILMTAISS
ncbi:class I SAM-dependent methyltransferase [Nocardia sp. NPDC088792]|uniref:class I SAM-dependent methyltransferase n=1 Tax=Nocardia sp. NPDC088792 TaxID=3364332 RepID=UPI003819138E